MQQMSELIRDCLKQNRPHVEKLVILYICLTLINTKDAFRRTGVRLSITMSSFKIKQARNELGELYLIIRMKIRFSDEFCLS